MKILMVNKFFYIKGGSETYYFALKKLLQENGHEVIDFSMKDPKNFPSGYADYFVEHVDYNAPQTPLKKLEMGAKIIYSVEAKRRLEELLVKTKPDVAHLHLFQHQLSPSILDVFRQHRIPILYTAHDLKMLCPNYKMMVGNQTCEACKGGRYWQCMRRRCVKGSILKSGVNTAEAYLHKWRKSYESIRYIITPSQFYRDKFIEFGVPKQKLLHIPNFLEDRGLDDVGVKTGDYLLYFGRLSEEKGVRTLLEAVKGLPVQLKIAGTGPDGENIRRQVKEQSIGNVELLGFQSGEGLDSLIRQSLAVVLPSEWYENCPYSGIEALMYGRPLIGSNLGGIPELIEEGANGYLFEPGSTGSLRRVILKLLNNPDYDTLQKNARKLYLSKYTARVHFERIRKVYRHLVETPPPKVDNSKKGINQ